MPAPPQLCEKNDVKACAQYENEQLAGIKKRRTDVLLFYFMLMRKSIRRISRDCQQFPHSLSMR